MASLRAQFEGSPGTGDEGAAEPEGLGIEEWNALTFSGTQLADDAISGNLADSDGDGRATIFEYLAGSSPLAYDAAPFFEMVMVSGGDEVRAVRWVQRRAQEGVQFDLEISQDLRVWTLVGDEVGARSATNLDSDREQITLQLNEISGARYLRGRATIGQAID